MSHAKPKGTPPRGTEAGASSAYAWSSLKAWGQEAHASPAWAGRGKLRHRARAPSSLCRQGGAPGAGGAPWRGCRSRPGGLRWPGTPLQGRTGPETPQAGALSGGSSWAQHGELGCSTRLGCGLADGPLVPAGEASCCGRLRWAPAAPVACCRQGGSVDGGATWGQVAAASLSHPHKQSIVPISPCLTCVLLGVATCLSRQWPPDRLWPT